MQTRPILQLVLAAVFFAHFQAAAASAKARYYGHEAVVDSHGVIAPWYQGLNGQCDFRVRIAAETLKRYPWTTTNTAIAAYPDYVFSGHWQITSNGVIVPQTPQRLGQRRHGPAFDQRADGVGGLLPLQRRPGRHRAPDLHGRLPAGLLPDTAGPPVAQLPHQCAGQGQGVLEMQHQRNDPARYQREHGAGPAARVSAHRQPALVRRREALGRLCWRRGATSIPMPIPGRAMPIPKPLPGRTTSRPAASR